MELDRPTWRALFGASLGVWLRGLADAGAETDFARLVTEGAPLEIVPELYRIARGRPRFATATLGLVALERLTKPFEKYTLKRVPPVAEIRAGLEAVLGPQGVIFYPPYSRRRRPRTSCVHGLASRARASGARSDRARP